MKKTDYQGFEQNTRKIRNFFISSAKKQRFWWGRWASIHEEARAFKRISDNWIL